MLGEKTIPAYSSFKLAIWPKPESRTVRIILLEISTFTKCSKMPSVLREWITEIQENGVQITVNL